MAGALKIFKGTAMSGHVVTFGEVLLRFATPGHRLTVQCDALDMVVGGAEANVAAGLASLGHAVRMLTRLPSSPLGDKARAALGSAGVDTSHIGRAPGRMGLYFLESGAGLRPSSITYDRAGSLRLRLRFRPRGSPTAPPVGHHAGAGPRGRRACASRRCRGRQRRRAHLLRR
jgi:sugar/nucleoside kinase (ribokinase family)